MTSVAAFLVILFATACNVLVVPLTPEQACEEQAQDFGPTFTVAGAFDTSVQALRDVRNRVEAEPELWPNVPNDTPAIVCFLDGPVPKAPPGGEQFDRAVIGVVGDEAVLLVAGYQDSIRVTRP